MGGGQPLQAVQHPANITLACFRSLLKKMLGVITPPCCPPFILRICTRTQPGRLEGMAEQQANASVQHGCIQVLNSCLDCATRVKACRWQVDVGRITDLVPGAPHNAGEDGARSIVAGKAGLDHSRSIVAHERRHFSVVSHLSSALLHSQRKILVPQYG